METRICPNCQKEPVLEDLTFCGPCYYLLMANPRIERYCLAIRNDGTTCDARTENGNPICESHRRAGYGVMSLALDRKWKRTEAQPIEITRQLNQVDSDHLEGIRLDPTVTS